MSEMKYDFLAPPRIVFGWGRRNEAGMLARTLGHRAFVISGSRQLEARGIVSELYNSLHEAGVEVIRLATISREPLIEDVDHAVISVCEYSPGADDLVVAIGGGAAIDLAKAVSALAVNRLDESVLDFLEGVGKGLQIIKPPLPMLAIPTTSGTGSEATKNAVISSLSPPFKKSLRSDLMVPRAVLVDPELTVSLPRNITAWTGMDAITQLIESYVTRNAKPIPQALALHGLELALPALATAVREGTSRPARERMAHAALLSGMTLANSGLGLAHGVAAALGVHCNVPHGLACAVMLPAAIRVNLSVREAEFAKLGTLFTGRTWPTASAAAQAALETIVELAAEIQIPRRLSEIGVRAEEIPQLVPASRGNSMNGNPRDVTDDELRTLLEEML